ncbi:MAG: hypothetical protein ABW046_13320 [Actinoplanes sp.]
MSRLDVLNRWRDGGKDENRSDDMHIELAAADHEEPTWEVRLPGDTKRRRLDGRTRSILIVAAVAAVVVNAGAAWAYWRITGSATEQAASGTSVELALRARSDMNRPLRAGATGNLTVTVTNENDFPIRITEVTPGAGNIVADLERREAGCVRPRVELTQPQFAVSWDVPRNTIGAFTIPGALTMHRAAGQACSGAMFTVPVQAIGVSRDVS